MFTVVYFIFFIIKLLFPDSKFISTCNAFPCPKCIPIPGCVEAPAGALLQHPTTVLQVDGHKLQNQEINDFCIF